MATAKMTAKQKENLAKEIHSFLVKHGLWVDCSIYFNGKCWSTQRKVGDRLEFCYNENRYFESVADPKDYFEYVRQPENILSMSFEGGLYEVLNGYHSYKLEAEFQQIFRKYGLYYEMGNSWNLSCYEI